MIFAVRFGAKLLTARKTMPLAAVFLHLRALRRTSSRVAVRSFGPLFGFGGVKNQLFSGNFVKIVDKPRQTK
jgi:hypothetical protein